MVEPLKFVTMSKAEVQAGKAEENFYGHQMVPENILHAGSEGHVAKRADTSIPAGLGRWEWQGHRDIAALSGFAQNPFHTKPNGVNKTLPE